MFKKRTLSKHLHKIIDHFPVLLITGPRQVGKTTLLKIAKKTMKYITLDDLEIRVKAQKDPKAFLEEFKPPLFVDEIQYAPDLMIYMKILIDENRRPNMFWLTGSQQFGMMKGVTESLAGRVGILDLQGLSQAEKYDMPNSIGFLPTKENIKKRTNKKINFKKLCEIILRGSFPQIVVDKTIDRKIFYNSYIRTYIERDVRALSNVENEEAFFKFLRAIAMRTGQLMNYADLARDAGIAPITAKSWLSILRTSGIIYTLEPYYMNRTKRFVKAPKVYFLDTGLCSYLMGLHTPKALETSEMFGAIFETYVVSEILKSYWHSAHSVELLFYRDRDGREVDIIVERDGMLYPIEIKKTVNPSKEDIKHFSALENLNMPIGHGAVICLSQDYLPINENVDAIPIGYL